MTSAATSWLAIAGLTLALWASALGLTGHAAGPTITNVTTSLTGTSPGTVSGIPPLQDLTIAGLQLAGTTGGDIVGTMALTMSVVSRAPSYGTASFSGTWAITSGADGLNGIMSGDVSTALNGLPPTQVIYGGTVNVVVTGGSGTYARVRGDGVYRIASSGTVDLPPGSFLPLRSVSAADLVRGALATSQTGTMELELTETEPGTPTPTPTAVSDRLRVYLPATSRNFVGW